MPTVLLLLLFPALSGSVTLWAEKEEASFLQNHRGMETLTSVFPVVHKCCPLGERWEGGGCVRSPEPFVQTPVVDPETDFEKDSWKGGDASSGALTEDDVHSTSHALTDGPVVFRLRVSMPHCSSSKNVIEKIFQKDVLRKERMINVSKIFNMESSGESTANGSDSFSSVSLSTEGHLVWKDRHGFLNMHRYNDFCIDQMNETTFVAIICEPRCDETQPCIRKCCSPGEIVDMDNEVCVQSRNEWSPYLYNESFTPVLDSKPQTSHYVYGVPDCIAYPFSPRQDPSDKMYILTNGSLVTVTRGRKIVYPLESFCVDGAVDHAPHSQYSDDVLHRQEPHEPVYFSGSELDQIAIICYPPIQNITKQDWRYGVYAKCELISSFFLFLTAIVYLILWEYQNIHGWLQFAYVGSCFFSFTFLAIVQLYTDEINDIDQNLCESMGAVIHFSFLAAFFWLTSMNFDLWWTFSGCRPLRPSSKRGDKKRFFIFAIFSWGFPGIIAGIGLSLDYVYKNDPDSGIVRPRFGDRKCYFYGSEELLPYFYGPVGFLLLIDLLFFINTVYSLQKLQKDTKFATRQSSKQDKKKFVLFMKIFIVMGVLWIFEVISWIAEVYTANEDLRNVFVPFDIINTLQGLWIFIIFTCKPNTCRQLEGKFKKLTIYMERQRDQEKNDLRPLSLWRWTMTCFAIVFCTLLLPFVHCFRRLFSLCGHRTRSLESGRTRSNTMTVTSATFDKCRKFSDCSTASTYAATDPSSSFEMESKSSRAKIMNS